MGAWLIEGLLLVVIAIYAALLCVAFCLLFTAHTIGGVWACAQYDVARLSCAPEVGEEQGKLHVVLRGAAIHRCGEGGSSVGVVHLLMVVVEYEDGLVGVFPSFAVDFEAGSEAPVLIKLYFVAYANLECAYGFGFPVMGGEAAAKLEMYALCVQAEAECTEQENEERVLDCHVEGVGIPSIFSDSSISSISRG